MEEKERQKERAAKAAALFIKNGMTVGLGTGSTAFYLIQEVGSMMAAGLRLNAVVTSEASGKMASSLKIPVISPEETDRIHLAIDGVDEIDGEFRAVKGGGGALLREKLIAVKAEETIWIMDESKLVKKLGSFPLAVETLPFGWTWTAEAIKRAGGRPALRSIGGEPCRTDNGNFILDVAVSEEAGYHSAVFAIARIPGVLETGYFDRICSKIIVGTGSGEVREYVNPDRSAAPWPQGGGRT